MSDEDLSAFHPTAHFEVDPPVLVRKLDRKSHWKGLAGQSIEERAEHCYDNAFRGESDDVSLYRINCAEDFASVVVGMNGTPGRPIEERAFFLAFPESLFEEHNLTLSDTGGETICFRTNQLHCSMNGERTDILSLIYQCMQNGANPKQLSRPSMKRAICRAKSMGCDAIPEIETHCACRPS